MRFFDSNNYAYYKPDQLNPVSFVCGYCNNPVSSDRGYKIGVQRDGSGTQHGGVYICPSCLGAVFQDQKGNLYPKPIAGSEVKNVPVEIDELYTEARSCCGVGAYTASVLCCRKILMHVAVDLGAEGNQSFLQYVQWMLDESHIPPRAEKWVDHIREKGNEANHEIVIMARDEAEKLVKFTEMLLKVNYEFPGLIQPPNASVKK